MLKFALLAGSALAFAACASQDGVAAEAADSEFAGFTTEEFGAFNEPWAMTFLPDGRLLVTEKSGAMHFVDLGGETPQHGTVTGLPEVDYGGQGGLGDVVAHPEFAANNQLYFSYAEAGAGGTRGAVVARGRLMCQEAESCRLEEIETIWRQAPKTGRRGHYSHRIAFSPDGQYLFIASGDRQELEPAQDTGNNLGTIVRLDPDGNVPDDNPMAGEGGTTAQIWSYGHRNPLGLAFSPDGRLWDVEHGPAGGDEVNLVEAGANYGWPTVSHGNHYDGRDIPDHETRPEFRAPVVHWTPVIAPGGMIFYTGDMFGDWQGDALIAGLAAEAIVRVEFDGDMASEAARYDLGARIREVEQGPDGAIWVLEDGEGGRLLRLTPQAGG